MKKIEIGTLAASALSVAFGLAYAQSTPHMFGSLFGLAPEQTVRVSIGSYEHKIDAHKLATNTCMVQLKIFSADGSVAVQSELLKILPGVSFSHDLKYSDLKPSGPILTNSLAATDFTRRAQLRVASYVSDIKGEIKGESCNNEIKMLKLAVEVFDDQTGRTNFMVPVDSFLPAVQ